MTTDLRRSPLHDRHVALGAKLADFGGWEMPIEYAGRRRGPGAHRGPRGGRACSTSRHLGKAPVRGPGAAAFVERCLTNDLGRIGPGRRSTRSAATTASGGVVDDLIAYLRRRRRRVPGPERGEHRRGRAPAARRRRRTASTVTDEHEDFGVLAVQGPRSAELLGAARAADRARLHGARRSSDWSGDELVVCRTGYTGEHGYELLAAVGRRPARSGTRCWRGRGPRRAPCGLGARDTLRTEMGYPLHGQDLSLEITPVQARSGWAVGWKKPAFWGRDALLAERAARSGPAAVGPRGAGARHPAPRTWRCSPARPPVGEVTSGTFSPTLKKGIALALLDRRRVGEGDEVVVDVRGRPAPVRVVKPPFVQSHVR